MQSKGIHFIFLFIAFFCLPWHYALANTPLAPVKDSTQIFMQCEDSLKQLQLEKIKPHTSDAYKLEANGRFLTILKNALSLHGSFNYPFDSLTTIGRLTSPDKKFRIVNWNVPKADGTIAYYGFIQVYDAKKNNYILYELKDKGSEISAPQTAVCTTDNWLGMLYYKIIPTEDEGKTIYTLLAWQGYSSTLNHKVIEVMYFNNQGEPCFGKNIFKKPPPGFKSSCKRIIFQYSADAFMSLEYNSDKKMIVFDRLEPPSMSLMGQYQYYAPNCIDVDGLSYLNGWQYQEDVNPRNPDDPNDKYYHTQKQAKDMTKKALYKSPH